MHFWDRLKYYIVAPDKQLARDVKVDIGTALRYYMGLVLIAAPFLIFMQAIFYKLIPLYSTKLSYLIFAIVISVALSPVVLLVNSVWLHIWLLFFAGKGKFTNTVKAVSFSSTPIIFSWVPLLNIIVIFWTYWLLYKALLKFHKVKETHVIGTILAAVFIPLIVLLVGILLVPFSLL